MWLRKMTDARDVEKFIYLFMGCISNVALSLISNECIFAAASGYEFKPGQSESRRS